MASSASGSSAATGQGGAGGAAPVCFTDCDITKATGRTGDYPCAVEKILKDNCQRCHTNPLMGGAPFPLVSYEDSQDATSKVIFAFMYQAVESEYMPLEPPKLTDDEKSAILDWACACAPPRDPEEICD
jgi:uncharacterized membrane protein